LLVSEVRLPLRGAAIAKFECMRLQTASPSAKPPRSCPWRHWAVWR